MAHALKFPVLRSALLLVGMAVAGSLAAQASPTWQVAGTLRVDGGSTVRSWSCPAGAFNAEITGASGATLALADVAQAVEALRLEIPTAGLDCDNDTMNDHMWKALQSEDHPLIVFRLESYAVTPAAGEGVTLELRGALDMTGASHPVTLTAQASEEPGGALRVAGMHTLDMTEWGISPPRLMLGTLRVRDDVEVHFDLVVSPR